MDIGKILLIVSSVALVLLFAIMIFASSKNKKAKKKVEKLKEETVPKPQTEEPQQKDESFKVVRESKSSRVSRKALKSNSRTATVEKVFERTPEQVPDQKDVEVQMSKDYDQSFTEAVEQVRSENKKVVSIGALIKNDDVPKNIRKNTGNEFTDHIPLNTRGDFPIDDIPDLDELRERIARRKREQQSMPDQIKPNETDINEMIEIDAIMNPKFKNTKK